MNDTIYRRDAIQALVDTEEIKGFAYKMLEDRLIGLPSANKWIPCSERLPERNGVYLVTVQNAEEGWAFVIHAWFNIEIPLIYGRKGWTPLNEFYDLANQVRPDIVAWMPLPEPWKGVDDDCI